MRTVLVSVTDKSGLGEFLKELERLLERLLKLSHVVRHG